MTEAIAAPSRFSIGAALVDCQVLVHRSFRHLTRNMDQTFQAIALPIVMVLLFRYLLGGAINTGGPSYVNYVIAGLIVTSVAMNSTSTAVGVAGDLEKGLVDRFRSMPMVGSAVLVGHVVSGVLRNLLSAVIVVALGLLVGFTPSAGIGQWLAALGVLLVFVTALSTVATLLGVLAGTVEGANGFAMILMFLPYASSSLVPPSTMPGVLRAFVENQPFSPVVDALRALLIGTPLGDSAWVALLWWGAILVVTGGLAVRTFNRRTAK